MSTERNIELLNKAKYKGYFIRGIYVLTSDPNINISRVRVREQAGGHMSSWYRDYYKIRKNKAALYAEKTWEFDYSKPNGGYTNYKYKLGNRKCSKKKYKKKLAILKDTKVIKEKNLMWKKL